MNPQSPFDGQGNQPQQPLQPQPMPQQPLPQVATTPIQQQSQPIAPQPAQPQQVAGGQLQNGSYPLFDASKNRGPKSIPWMFIIPIVVLTLALMGMSYFVYATHQEKEDYKNNSDQKVAAAVTAAKQETEKIKEAEFLEREKSPYKVYQGPGTFGSMSITYPKSWAAFVDETSNGSAPINGFFHPGFVPGGRSGTAFALRVEVVERPYDQMLKQYEALAKQNKVRISAYKAPKVPAVLGSRIDGEISRGLNGSAILLPLRDKTIRLSVESQTFMKDFNGIILANFVFTP